MAAGIYILFASDRQWQIASPGAMDDVRMSRDATPAQIAADVSNQLRSRGYQGQGLLLALPAKWCLCARISTADLPRNDRAAMAFRLEEKLPLAAENFTADFVVSSERALGVCTMNDKVRLLIDALEKTGVVVQSVVPAAMLAVQAWILAQRAGKLSEQLLILPEEDSINLIALKDGLPSGWALSPVDSANLSIQLELALLEFAQEPQVLAFVLPGDVEDVLREKGLKFTAVSEAFHSVASRSARDILAGSLTPWFEFRRGALAAEDHLRAVRRSLNFALAAAAIFCIVTGGAFLYRSIRYDRLADQSEQMLSTLR